MAIINGDSWKEALRNAVGDETPMRRMIHKLPGGWSQNNCCVTCIHQVKGRSSLSEPFSHFGLCVHTYVRMYVCIPIYSSYVCTYIFPFILHTYVHTYIRMYVCTYIFPFILHTYVHTYIRMYVCTYIFPFTLHTYVRTYLPHGCTVSVSPPSQMWPMLFLIAV